MKRLAILALLALAAWTHGTTGAVGPVLSAQSTTVQGWSDVRGYVTTDTGSGTIYTVVQTAAISAPSATQIKTCKAGDNTTPAACTSTAIASSGAKGPIKLGCTQSTCLVPLTSYKLYFVQNTSSDSNVVNAAFTTGGQLQITSQPDTFSAVKWNDNPNVAQWNAVRDNLVAFVNATYSPPINVPGFFYWGWQYLDGNPIGCFAESLSIHGTVSYSTAVTGVRAKLLALPNQNTVQSAAYSHLPNTDPTTLGDTYDFNTVQGAIIYPGYSSIPSTNFGFISLCNTTWNTVTDGTTNNGNIQLWGVMHHEITEMLGRFSGWNFLGVPGVAMELDVMRFGSTGVIKTSVGSGVAYPSSDNGATSFYGGTSGFNNPSNCQNGGGDCADLTGSGGTATSSFTANGVSTNIGNPPLPADMKLMTILGYTLSEKGQTCMEQASTCSPF